MQGQNGVLPQEPIKGGLDNPPVVRLGDSAGGATVASHPEPKKDTRFFMSVRLDNTRVIRDLQKYLDEVISHLSSVDECDVEINLEVSAHATEGFPQGTVRTVSENCRTLRVDDFGFEK